MLFYKYFLYSGVKIETRRYGANRMPHQERLCETCNVVEDSYHVHVLLQCLIYADFRIQFL